MNKKILILTILITLVFLSATIYTPPLQAVPENKLPCNSCHATGGAGSLSVTYLNGSRPKGNAFTINTGETISLVLQGVGATDRNQPGVSLALEAIVHHHLTVKGAADGGEGSYAFYVRDKDANDNDPDESNVRGLFQLTADSTIPVGEYNVVASYLQAGPSGLNVNLRMKVVDVKREPSGISIVVSPETLYAEKDSVFVSGSIKPQNAENVTLEYKGTEDWRVLTVLKPNPDGSFFYEWKPTSIENYDIRAQFFGNKDYTPSISNVVNISVLKSPQTFLNQMLTGVLVGMLVIFIGIGLFYIAGRSRYLTQVSHVKTR